MKIESMRTIAAAVILAASMPVVVAASEEAAETRIAAISGVHTPHQGFALSSVVPSDRMCLELAQNLASELGILVHVICTDPSTGETTAVAECGYADDKDASVVDSFSRSGGLGGSRFLVCVPPDPDRFRAERVAPDVAKLRPRARKAP